MAEPSPEFKMPDEDADPLISVWGVNYRTLAKGEHKVKIFDDYKQAREWFNRPPEHVVSEGIVWKL